MLARDPAFAWLDRDVELTADDFKFAMDLLMDPNVDCPSLRNYYEDFAGCEVVDRFTFRMRWKRTVYTSLSSSLSLSPIPRHIYGRNADGSEIPAATVGVVFNKHWFDERNGVAGVGAYILEEYRTDDRMVFRRNPDYWGVPLHFERIEWNLQIKQDDPQLIAFKNAQVHSHGLSPLKYKSEILDHSEKRFARLDPNDPTAGRSGELGWERVKGMSFQYIGWNMRKTPFDDKRVRQAMTHAFPKERIIKDVFYGLGKPVLSDVLLDSQYCNTELAPYAFDLGRAKALLTEAGWSDSDGDGVLDRQIGAERKPFSFEVKYFANSPEWDNTLAVYRKELQKLGVDMKPVPYEFKELMRIYEDKDFNAVVGGWQMDWDLDYFQLWHSSQVDLQGSSNHCGFANKRVDELADQLRQTFEVPKRIAIAKEIQAIIHEEQPYTFFKSGEGIFVWQNRPASGQPMPPERYLAGVIKGLDSFHPLVNRTRTVWHFRT
jgi:ABC-type transport system substrate-binding protein